MSTLDSIEEKSTSEILYRRSIEGNAPNVFTDIYRNDANIVIWKRELPNELSEAVSHILESPPTRAKVLVVSPQNTHNALSDALGESSAVATLSDDIALLVDMFCCLFDLTHAGLRLTVLDSPMCPRFHVDHIPCRLVTTYRGIATEWLNHDVIDRTKLGAGNQGKSDEESGLFESLNDINRLSEGDVALLKGENWDETKDAGLVHRSPSVSTNERRLLLTLDFIAD